MSRTVSLSSQDITDAEINAVVSVLKSDRLALGPQLTAFEDEFRRRVGVKHAISCCNGTAGLHMCWTAMGIGANDEVITTPFTFISTVNSFAFNNAKPVFVDVDPETWQLDAKLIEAAITPRTRAVIPVDIFGNTPDWDPILDIAKRHNLRVLEDSCEALGAAYKDRPTGTFGEAGVFAFYPNKQITTGEGGMVVTNDDRIAFLVRSLCNQGRDPDAGWLAHARLGYNYRMCDIQAAVGVQQMRRLDEILAKRDRVANMYLERLAGDDRYTTMKVPAEVKISWFVFVVRLNDNYTQQDRDRILEGLREKGIGCNNYFSPVHLQPHYAETYGYKQGDFPVTETLAQRTIALPFHNHITEEEADYVACALKSLV